MTEESYYFIVALEIITTILVCVPIFLYLWLSTGRKDKIND